ncbi:uncharacterized protein LOC111479627 isoform X2 [Cucurbita maxima]|uniref:Uncharacterized protein LOC111479627 isoform X2 n=1 Tax=Cucurbita maxima TaxID=3661 RepID=A0A6J1IYF9_CUCMA|nr:uncharacterized protein LOC111479627 isoform X2 [Cucurbita maxima]
MVSTAAATAALKIGVPAPIKSEKKPPTNFTRLAVCYPNCFLNTRPKVPAIRALGQEGNSSGGDDDTGISQDVQFVLKMAAGSIAVGGGIKYGSIIFPEMTKPNIVQALIMVSTPVVVAICLLINQSRQDRQS